MEIVDIHYPYHILRIEKAVHLTIFASHLNLTQKKLERSDKMQFIFKSHPQIVVSRVESWQCFLARGLT